MRNYEYVMRLYVYIYFYFIASGEINVHPIWIKWYFSQVEEYDIFTSEKLRRCYFHYSFRITSICFILSLTDADPTSVF